MYEFIRNWYRRKFSDPNSVTLFLVLLVVIVALYSVGSLLIPVLVALSIAYLLDWPVNQLSHYKLSRSLATSVIMVVFVGVMVSILVGILPVLWQQLTNLLQESPTMLEKGKGFLLTLPEEYPNLITPEQISAVVHSVERKLLELGQMLLSLSLTSLKDVVAWLIYLILVPLLVFFMLKDKAELSSGFIRIMPTQRKLISQVWLEMNQQIMNYIRGKVLEMLIVGSVSYATFWLLDLRYAALLGVLVGVSVLIPFIGAALVTIPVTAVALFQFGVSQEFWTVFIAYAIIQTLDGNLLVPVLFSEAVDLNPVYIIVAVLLFGGLWGFWGVFFAIPLASLVKALINAWSGEHQQISEGFEDKPPA